MVPVSSLFLRLEAQISCWLVELLISHIEYNPILFFFILDEVVVLIYVPSIFVVDESFSCVFKMLQTHTGSLADEIPLHFVEAEDCDEHSADC